MSTSCSSTPSKKPEKQISSWILVTQVRKQTDFQLTLAIQTLVFR